MNDIGLLFDHDGTLFNSLPNAFEATCETCKILGARVPTWDEYLRKCYPPFPKFYSQMGVECDEEEIWRVFKLSFDKLPKPTFFKDVQLLPWFRRQGMELSLVSSGRYERLRSLYSENEIDIFQGYECGVEDKVPAIREFVQRNGFQDSNVWYVGDFISDIRDALKAGVRPIGITRGNKTETQLREAGAEYVIENLSQLRAVFRHVLSHTTTLKAAA
jgi:phosphoglycolate phosphatase